ncbi:sulfotransferase family protein [Labrenzia sp. 011]|uniref:sulfotransferase family protein n=1 Tax=Labrenzia sp. 011 TaxID=2171494 RepID=UPI000D516F46|nr:sulfotransferase family protein [Labrenzia sp. 011]PVB62407.1 hypothetical protein DCO57_06520 [Labrenzia sp. 011]
MKKLISLKKHKLKKAIAKKLILRNDINHKNFYNADCVAIFPEIRVCFNRIKKSGNTSVCAVFSEISGYPEAANTIEMKRRISTPHSLRLSELRDLRNYHSFLVTRDPYTRALSAFLDKVGSGKDALFQKVPGFGDESREGFAKFVDFLGSGGISFDRHFWPQTDLLYQPVHNFSYVAKLENLSHDLPDFLQKIGVSVPTHLQLDRPHNLEKSEPGKVTSAQSRLSRYYNDTLYRDVEKIYRADFDEFNYHRHSA